MAEFHYTGKKPTKRRLKITESNKLSLDEYKQLFTRGRISADPEIQKRARAGLLKYGIQPQKFTKSMEYIMMVLEIIDDYPDYVGSRKFINDSKIAIGFGDKFYGTILVSEQ